MSADREKVINRMETICNICKENTWRTEFSSDTIYPLLRDAIALLKEQQEQIDRLIEENASNAEMAEGMKELLKELEAKTGHWIDTTKVIGFPRVQCSVCGSGQGAIWMNYCPNCGAKMEGR